MKKYPVNKNIINIKIKYKNTAILIQTHLYNQKKF